MAGYKVKHGCAYRRIAIPSITVVSKATLIGINYGFTSDFDLFKLLTIYLSFFITPLLITERLFFRVYPSRFRLYPIQKVDTPK